MNRDNQIRTLPMMTYEIITPPSLPLQTHFVCSKRLVQVTTPQSPYMAKWRAARSKQIMKRE